MLWFQFTRDTNKDICYNEIGLCTQLIDPWCTRYKIGWELKDNLSLLYARSWRPAWFSTWCATCRAWHFPFKRHPCSPMPTHTMTCAHPCPTMPNPCYSNCAHVFINCVMWKWAERDAKTTTTAMSYEVHAIQIFGRNILDSVQVETRLKRRWV